jgi:outer membrane lipoprotein-sorting protein
MNQKQIIVGLCIVVSLLSTACTKVMSSLSSPARSSVGGDPREDLIKWMTGQEGAKSFRAHSVSASTQGESNSEIEFVAPDRYHFTIRKAGGAQTEMIIADGKTFVKSGDRPWQLVPGDVGAFLKSFRDPQTMDYLKKSTDIKFVGTDTLDGAPVWVYEYTFQFNKSGASEAAHHSKVWVGSADGLPRRVETVSEISGYESKLTTTYSDYNSDIKIESPI